MKREKPPPGAPWVNVMVERTNGKLVFRPAYVETSKRGASVLVCPSLARAWVASGEPRYRWQSWFPWLFRVATYRVVEGEARAAPWGGEGPNLRLTDDLLDEMIQAVHVRRVNRADALSAVYYFVLAAAGLAGAAAVLAYFAWTESGQAHQLAAQAATAAKQTLQLFSPAINGTVVR